MSSKWVEVVDVQRVATEVASEILSLRTQRVQQLLPLAAYEFRQDVEHVHQLRVACRRADAALQAFRPLAHGKAKRLRKWFKKIRQAAGPARDTDVLLTRLKAESKQAPGHEYLVARLKQQRVNVQPGLIEVAKAAEATKDFQKSIQRYLAVLQQAAVKEQRHGQSSNPISFYTLAHQALRFASQGMLQLSGIEQPTIAQLHELRIAGKRLRYSVELFHSAFPISLREEVYPLIEKIQSRLGSLNDHATAQALLQQWLADLPPDERAAQFAERIVVEHEQAEQIRTNFLEWWTPKRVATLESHLSELIHNPLHH